MDVGEPLWEGVEWSTWNGEDDTIPEAAFEQVILRMFHVYIDAAMASGDPIVGTPRWLELLANVAAIEAQGRGR